MIISSRKRENSASVRVGCRDESLCVIISDEGKGFDPVAVWQNLESEQKFGLLSIRERLQHLGGSLDVESRPGEGVTISLIVPIGASKQVEKELLDSGFRYVRFIR